MSLNRYFEEPGQLSSHRIQQARRRVQQIFWCSNKGKEGLESFQFLQVATICFLNSVVIWPEGVTISIFRPPIRHLAHRPLHLPLHLPLPRFFYHYAETPEKGPGCKRGRSEIRDLDCRLIENLMWSGE